MKLEETIPKDVVDLSALRPQAQPQPGPLLSASQKAGAAGARAGLSASPSPGRTAAGEPLRTAHPTGGQGPGLGRAWTATSGSRPALPARPAPPPLPRGPSSGSDVATGASPAHALWRKGPRLAVAEAGDAGAACLPRCGTVWSASWVEVRRPPLVPSRTPRLSGVSISSPVSYGGGGLTTEVLPQPRNTWNCLLGICLQKNIYQFSYQEDREHVMSWPWHLKGSGRLQWRAEQFPLP